MDQFIKAIDEAKAAHVVWVQQHPNFIDRDTGRRGEDYIIILEDIYKSHRNNAGWFSRRFDLPTFIGKVYYHLRKDIKFLNKVSDLDNVIKEQTKLALGSNVPLNKWFITIGFNHQTYNIKECCVVIGLVLSHSIVKEGEAVFEFHRENGFHPHCHFLLQLNDTLPKSKIVEKLFAIKGMKKVVLSKTFIDVKQAEEYHIKYLKGDKTQEKMECVEKDIEFRNKNSIPQKFFSQAIL